MNGQWVNCELETHGDTIARISLRRAVTIPAFSEMVIYAKANEAHMLNTSMALIEPYLEDDPILIAHSLVNPLGKRILIIIINLSQSPIKLKKNHIIGALCPVDSISEDFDKCEVPDKSFPSSTLLSGTSEWMDSCKLSNTVAQQGVHVCRIPPPVL